MSGMAELMIPSMGILGLILSHRDPANAAPHIGKSRIQDAGGAEPCWQWHSLSAVGSWDLTRTRSVGSIGQGLGWASPGLPHRCCWSWFVGYWIQRRWEGDGLNNAGGAEAGRMLPASAPGTAWGSLQGEHRVCWLWLWLQQGCRMLALTLG